MRTRKNIQTAMKIQKAHALRLRKIVMRAIRMRHGSSVSCCGTIGRGA